MGVVIDGVILTPLQQIKTPGGDVWHGMRNTEDSFAGFGEAYLSNIDSGAIKPWKKHLSMTLNLIVVVGEIRFVLYDDRPDSMSSGSMQTAIMSPQGNYARLTVPPGIWMAFQGLFFPGSILLNIANLVHDPDEIIRLPLESFEYNWEDRP